MKIFLFAIACILASCVTPAEKEKLNADIFYLKTKLLSMEGRVKGQDSKTTNQGKTLATSHSRLDKIEFALQKAQGDMEALRIGVVTGQMPGVDPEQSGSIAKSIEDLSARLDKIEASQAAILASMEELAKKTKAAKAAKAAKASKKKVTLKSLTQSFDQKRYRYVAQDAPKFIKSAKKKDKQAAMFLLAESLYKLGKLRDAALKYNDYIALSPKKHLAHAKLRMGDCFRHLGENSTAKLYYEELMSQFPSTSEAQKAKERMQKM